MGEKSKGSLIIIGGAEDKEGNSDVLKYVSETVKELDNTILILTTATEEPKKKAETYEKVFKRLGVKSIDWLDIDSRENANTAENSQKIRNAKGIFFTGGDQLRITSILGGTRVYDALHDAYSEGAVIVGTSAGASVMCSTMVVSGKDNEPARKCTLKMAPGLGFLEEALVDQHFEQRGRLGRLLSGIAENPTILGIGIDEDTAIRVYPDAHFDVIGTNAVTVVDGKSITGSNVSEQSPDEILTITNVKLHILAAGSSFDMKTRKTLRP